MKGTFDLKRFVIALAVLSTFLWALIAGFIQAGHALIGTMLTFTIWVAVSLFYAFYGGSMFEGEENEKLSVSNHS